MYKSRDIRPKAVYDGEVFLSMRLRSNSTKLGETRDGIQSRQQVDDSSSNTYRRRQQRQRSPHSRAETLCFFQPSTRARSPRTACNFCHDKRVKCVMPPGETVCEQCAQRNTKCIFSVKVQYAENHCTRVEKQ